MSFSSATKVQIVRALDELSPEHLGTLAEFVEFLRAKNSRLSPISSVPRRIVKLGGLWQGYSFSEDEIRSTRREVWASLGKDFDA